MCPQMLRELRSTSARSDDFIAVIFNRHVLQTAGEKDFADSDRPGLQARITRKKTTKLKYREHVLENLSAESSRFP